MKKAWSIVGSILVALVIYYLGMGAGANRKAIELKANVPVTAKANINVEELETTVEALEARVEKMSKNHNGLVAGLQQEIKKLMGRDDNAVISMALLERVLKNSMGEKDYKKTVNEARAELDKEFAAIQEQRHNQMMAQAQAQARAKAQADAQARIAMQKEKAKAETEKAKAEAETAKIEAEMAKAKAAEAKVEWDTKGEADAKDEVPEPEVKEEKPEVKEEKK